MPGGAEARTSFGAVGYRPRDEPGIDGLGLAGSPLSAGLASLFRDWIAPNAGTVS